jgi:hypothetical protein
MEIRSPLFVHQFKKCIDFGHSKLPVSQIVALRNDSVAIIYLKKKSPLLIGPPQANLGLNRPKLLEKGIPDTLFIRLRRSY